MSPLATKVMQPVQHLLRASRALLTDEALKHDLNEEQRTDLHIVHESAENLRDTIQTLIANDALGDLTRYDDDAGHDLRGLINPITGYVQLLRDGYDGPLNEAQRATLDAMHRDSFTLLANIDNLWDYAKLLHGRFTPTVTTFNTQALRERLRRLPFADQHRWQINLTNEATLRGDILYLWASLYRLLENAVKFTPPGGDISVSDQADGDALVLCVSDSGPGVPPQDAPHLFDAFWQADANTPGLGLGLYLAHESLQRQQMPLSVATSAHKGAVFHLRVPFA